MRASVAIAQQTLTAEAANVLKHAVSDAQRRGHAQITPLHVASSLLTTTGSMLRQACLQSHRHMPHPLQCRALELCFNVALERLPTVQASHVAAPQPSFSNALVAALKRAQAHQRRGCPEQQQVPLLAVKVEMEQLIISILDDPSVSRVMREAGFSSTHVKNSLEEAIGSSSMHSSANVDLSHLKFSYAEPIGLKLGGVGSLAKHAGAFHNTDIAGLSSIGISQARECPTFLLPVFQSEQHRSSIASNLLGRASEGERVGSREQAVRDVVEVLTRQHKRNPLIVGEPEMATNAVVKELLEHLERGDIDANLKGVKLVSPQLSTSHQSKEEMEQELLHLRRVLDQNLSSGVIVFLGDVQWLVDRMAVGVANSLAHQAADELERLLLHYGGCGRLWFMGTATSQTYLRCQARNPSLETEWGFQPVRISLGSNVRMLPRFEQPADKAEASEVSFRSGWSQARSPINLLRLLDDCPDDLRCCPECVSNFGNEFTLLQEQELTSNPESAHSSSSPVDIFGEKPLYAEPANLSAWLQSKFDIHHPKESMVDKLDRQSYSLAQKLRNLRGKWNSICHTQHKEFHNSRQATPILLHESASSSSRNPAGKFFDERLQSESPRCASLDVSGASSELGRGCHKLSIATKPTWLSLQPQPTSEVLVGSTVELNMVEMGRVGSLAISPLCLRDSERSISPKEDLSYSYSAERLDQQESELTVQTDLALGRSVEQAKGSADSVSTILLGGRNALYKPITVRNNKIASETAEMPVFPWKDRLRSIPVSLSTDSRPSNDIADKLKQNSFPFREMKQVDADAVKDLQTKLEAKVPWQKEVIKSIATAVLQCRSGSGKKRGINVKKDTWLLFLGSDCVGKRNMAKALAEAVYGSQKKLFRISFKQEYANFAFLGDSQENNLDEIRVSNRGKTILDRIAEAVRLNPLSVVLLEDIDQADNVTRNALSRAMEKGRLQESNGREVNFSNVIVAMTSSAGAENCPKQQCSMNIRFSEERLLTSLGCGMRVLLEKESSKGLYILNSSHISVVDYASLEQKSQGGINQSPPLVACSKRKANTGIEATCDQEKKRTKENFAGRLLELDLNLPVNSDEEVSAFCPFFASNQSLSDAVHSRAQDCLMKGFGNLFDSVVTFEAFNFDEIADNVLDLLNRTTSLMTVSKASMEIDITVIEHLVAAVWEGLCDNVGLENWLEEVLKPSISNLFQTSKVLPGMVTKLVSEKSALSRDCFTISGLPKSISVGSGL